MSFKAIRENKILPKISEFTVFFIQEQQLLRLNIMEIFAQFSERNKNIADLNFGIYKWHNSKVPNLSHQS